MYILINKHNYNTEVYKDKIQLVYKLNITVKTLSRHLDKHGSYQNDTYIVVIPSYIQSKSGKGGLRVSNKK